jgi:ribosomal protein L11 methyltransferase
MNDQAHLSNGWVDVCIAADVDAGEVLSRLGDPAAQGAWEEGGVVHLYWPEGQWSGDRLAAVRRAVAAVNPLAGETALSVNRLPAKDWNEQWARSVKPLKIGRVVIRPSWETVALRAAEVEIILDPKQAFGTGHHATTRMLLEWLQDIIRGGERVLDVGAGSAILAMAAVKLGAASALGVECDPVAVECAREYVQTNRLETRIRLYGGTLGDLHDDPISSATLVLANLDRATLLALSSDLARYAARGARLLLSGLLVEQEAEVLDRYATLGLARAGRREQEGWVALDLLMPESCEGAG